MFISSHNCGKTSKYYTGIGKQLLRLAAAMDSYNNAHQPVMLLQTLPAAWLTTETQSGAAMASIVTLED